MTNRTRLNLLAALPRHSIGAELGVFAGDFSRQILRIVEPEVLFLVDTFTDIVSSGDENGRSVRQLDMAAQYQSLRAEFADRPGVHIVRSDSVSWLRQIKPGLLDWCYIDTDHSYATTCAELKAAALAVKPGGFICGHDFCMQFPGVIQAIEQFTREHQLSADIFDGDGLASYLIKNSAPSAVKNSVQWTLNSH